MAIATFMQLAQAVTPFGIAARRHLHQHPELSFHERETMAFVAAKLRELGYEPQTNVGGYGIKVVVAGGRPGKTVALRADMDALPIHEETGLAFASAVDGVMHACGHDMHTATLLATAKALLEVKDQLAGNVVLIFQPAEETPPGGAQAMIKDGVLEHPHVDAAFGMHIDPFTPAGQLTFRSGPHAAAADMFDIHIYGRGGHGAAPHNATDALYIAAQAVVALQGIHSRLVNPHDPLVISVCSMHAGSKHNIIPGEALLQGTVRTCSDALWQQVPGLIERVLGGVTAAYGGSYQLDYQRGYPVLINDEAMTEVARQAALAVVDPANVKVAEPGMFGEDFAYFARAVPASFGGVGVGDGSADPCYPCHHPKLMVADEIAMPIGVAYFLSVVQQYLNG